jgi:dihydropteroate synthase
VIGGPGHGLPAGSLSCAAMINAAADTVADLQARGTVLPTGSRCLIMGVVNVTPDSFHDGGRWLDPATAIAHGVALAGEGADMLDVGGESTRPGADRVSEDEELARVIPVIGRLAAAGAVVSVDTTRARVAAESVAAGARIVNDVSGGLADPAMADVVARTGVAYVAMHWRGHSDVMDDLEVYDDVVADVRAELAQRLDALHAAGVAPEQVILDPGLGFSKAGALNWPLLAHLDALHALGRPVLVGASRKRFLGHLLARPAADGRADPVPSVDAVHVAAAWEDAARTIDDDPVRRPAHPQQTEAPE